MPRARSGFLQLAFLSCCAAGSCVLAQTGADQANVKISADGTKLFAGAQLLLEAGADGFMSIHSVRFSPQRKHFLVIGCGYECNDNVGFLFDAAGAGKRKFTARWDFILQDKVEWAADGQKIFYYRINSSGADPPPQAPPSGWMQVEVKTGRKSPAVSRQLKTSASYGVFRVRSDDVLKVRAAPGVKSPEIGALPHDAKGIKVTAAGKMVGRDTWVPVRYKDLAGWVNQSYLYEEFEPYPPASVPR